MHTPVEGDQRQHADHRQTEEHNVVAAELGHETGQQWADHRDRGQQRIGHADIGWALVRRAKLEDQGHTRNLIASLGEANTNKDRHKPPNRGSQHGYHHTQSTNKGREFENLFMAPAIGQCT